MRYLLVFLLFTTNVSAQVVDGAFPVVSNLKAGVAKVEITPDDGETKAAIVTLEKARLQSARSAKP